MTGGGEGPSVPEVAASLPARLLGSMEELNNSGDLDEEERKRKRFISLKIQREVILSLSARSGFIGLKLPNLASSKGAQVAVSNLKRRLSAFREVLLQPLQGLTPL